MRRFLTAATAIITAALLLASPTVSAEYAWIPTGTSGLVKVDFSLDLRECISPVTDLTDCVSIPTTSITVHEAVSGHYLIAGLPDVEAGSSTGYALLGTFSGTPFSYVWPRGTITPQSTSSVVSYQIPDMVRIAAGDTLPVAEVSVSGLASDPTGATVVFNLWHISGTQVLSDVSATIPAIDAQTDGTWRATLRHSWLTSETSPLSGQYYGRFTITFSGGGTMTVPPDPNRLRVQVFP